MFQQYFVNKQAQANGDYEVHNYSCGYLIQMSPENKKSLGHFNNCGDAVTEARKHHPTANGCFFCSKTCHTS